MYWQHDAKQWPLLLCISKAEFAESFPVSYKAAAYGIVE